MGDSVQARFPAFPGIGGTTERIAERVAQRKQKSDHTWTDVKAKLADFDRVALLRLSQSLYAADKEHQRFIHARFGLAEDVLEPYKKPLERWLFGLMCSPGRTLLSPKPACHL